MIEAAVVTFLIWLAGVFSGLFLMRVWMCRRRRTLADIGPMLLAKRTKCGLTQLQAGGRCGISAWSYGRYERGNLVRDIYDLCKLAIWLGIEPGEFLHEDHFDDVALPAPERTAPSPDAGSAGPDREEAGP